MKIKITGFGPVLTIDGEEYGWNGCFSTEKENVKVEADGKDITDQLGETIVGPCIAGRAVDFYITSIYGFDEEEGDVKWKAVIDIDVDDFDPSKLKLYFTCDGDEESGELYRCEFMDGADLLPPSYCGNMVNYDGKDYFGDIDNCIW